MFPWKHRTEKLKTKNKRYRNTIDQNSERLKPSFSKGIGRKCRLISTRTEQNNDHTRIMHKIQFRSSFKQIGRCSVGGRLSVVSSDIYMSKMDDDVVKL